MERLKYFGLKNMPDRAAKPREVGITMVMDKGLGLHQAKEFVETAGDFVDVIKLGFGTSAVTKNLDEKLEIYREAKIPFYFGGTLFEAFVARDQFSDYEKLVKHYKLEIVEVSDGCLEIPHEKKCEYIRILSQSHTVLSEVGSKDKEVILPPYKWIELMYAELNAGADRIIAEAREGGNIGIYRSSGEVRMGLVDEILTEIDEKKIIWEAPQKAQQDWFIKLIGCNVNLGNIAPHEVIPLETLRLGLRGDTFHQYL